MRVKMKTWLRRSFLILVAFCLQVRFHEREVDCFECLWTAGQVKRSNTRSSLGHEAEVDSHVKSMHLRRSNAPPPDLRWAMTQL